MPHDLGLLATITMAFLTAFIGGFIARKSGLPTLVGYLLAGGVELHDPGRNSLPGSCYSA
jgi:CPA2 family monovalent cation:H+ antiporter-2